MIPVIETPRLILRAHALADFVDGPAVDDGVGRHRLAAEGRDFEGLAGRFQLDRFDGARSDIQADQGFRFAKHRCSPIL